MSLKCSIFRLIESILGVIFGFSGIICFSVLGNQKATFFAFLTLVFAALNVLLHILYLLEKLSMYDLQVFNDIKCFSFFSFMILFGVFIFILFLIFYWKVPVDAPVNSSLIIVAVWVFLSMKYAFLLRVTSNRYIKILALTGRPLLSF